MDATCIKHNFKHLCIWFVRLILIALAVNAASVCYDIIKTQYNASTTPYSESGWDEPLFRSWEQDGLLLWGDYRGFYYFHMKTINNTLNEKTIKFKICKSKTVGLQDYPYESLDNVHVVLLDYDNFEVARVHIDHIDPWAPATGSFTINRSDFYDISEAYIVK